MKEKEYSVFGAQFHIHGDSDDTQTWIHELTEMFLYRDMKIWHSVRMKSVEHLLESKDFSVFEEKDWWMDICHLLAPCGYNCLIGRKEE